MIGAKNHIAKKIEIKSKDLKILDLKLKKELSNKKLSNHKKYTLAVLAAREFIQLNEKKGALDFYLIAKAISVDEDKNEVNLALSAFPYSTKNIFFFDVNLKNLIQKRFFEKAILSLNPEKLKLPQFSKYRIIYDLLNVNIKKRMVKDLYCFQDYQNDPDRSYQYSTLACELLINYLQTGKPGNDQIKIIEEYFLKHDLNDRYILNLIKDI